MPLLTFQLALVLVACYVVGALITWLLQERRHKREMRSLEQHMTRALQARYEVYEGLEQTVMKLIGRFDAMQADFQRRLTEASNPRASLDKTVRLRSSNPDLWDIEREHYKVHSEQMTEIARQSQRLTELMDTLQSLEPGKNKLEGELRQLRSRYQNAVANATDSGKASEVKIQRLEATVRQLEPLQSMHEATRRELEQAQRAMQEREAAHQQELQSLRAQIDSLQVNNSRTAELEQALAQRDKQCHDLTNRSRKLESDMGGLIKRLESAEARCALLDQERTHSQRAFQDVASKLELTRSSQSEMQRELDKARAALVETDQRCKNQQSTLVDAMLATDELRSQFATAKTQLAERDQRVAKLESELEALRVEAKTQRTKATDDLVDARNQMQMALSDCEALRLRLAEAETRSSAVHSHGQAERSRLERELASVRADLEGRCTKAQEDAVAARGSLSEANTELDKLRAKLSEVQVQYSNLQKQSQQERSKLDATLRTIQTENALYRSKLNAQSSHVGEAWSLLTELKPMLETLEQKLKKTDEPAPAIPGGRQDESSSASKSPAPAKAVEEEGFDLSMLDDPSG